MDFPQQVQLLSRQPFLSRRQLESIPLHRHRLFDVAMPAQDLQADHQHQEDQGADAHDDKAQGGRLEDPQMHEELPISGHELSQQEKLDHTLLLPSYGSIVKLRNS